VDAGWIDAPGEAIIARATGLPVKLINDADAAGLAEVRFGAGKGQKGVVILITIGTGLGSALFVDGILVPNTEFGHMKIRGKDAEVWASEAAREREEMSWKKWARHFNRFISELDKLFWPELFILGGGGSNKHEKFLHLLTANARIVPAQLLNDAGIVGAALAAQGIG
jgi:polyphosphate glucokinase